MSHIAANGIGNFQAKSFVENEFILLPKDVAARETMLEAFRSLTETTLADQISNLRRTRDLLMPMLISGAIDVSALPAPEGV